MAQIGMLSVFFLGLFHGAEQDSLSAGMAESPKSNLLWDWKRLRERALFMGSVELRDENILQRDPYQNSAITGFSGIYLSDLELAFTFTVLQQHRTDNLDWVGVVFRSPDLLENGYLGHHYLLILRSNGEVSLQFPAGATLQTAKISDYSASGPVRVQVSAKGNRIVLHVNEQVVLDVTHDGEAAGEFGLVNYGNDVVYSDIRCSGMVAERPEPRRVEPRKAVAKPLNDVPAVPRISTRKVDGKPAEFYIAATGERFVPHGFNYTVLEPKRNWHGTFNVGVYDPEATEKVLATLAGIGANVVRFWAWGTQGEGGFTGGPESRGLNEKYMENVVDFMRRAIRHGLYLVPILDEFPVNAYYTSIENTVDATEKSDARIVGYNRQYLTRGRIEAKARAAADFVRYIAEANPNLLTSVLGWSLANEIFVVHSAGPFCFDKGVIHTANGKSYDMADTSSRQQCYDENILFWANRLADAIREVDPQAMVTAGMWTSDAHGRPPVNGILPDEKDQRRPPRPSVFAAPDCKLSFIDIHIYQWDGTSRINREAHETDVVLAGDKPVLVGEFNVFEKEAKLMRAELAEMARNIFELGYAGALLWDWHLNPVHENTGSYAEDDISGYIMQVLREYAGK